MNHIDARDVVLGIEVTKNSKSVETELVNYHECQPFYEVNFKCTTDLVEKMDVQ